MPISARAFFPAQTPPDSDQLEAIRKFAQTDFE